MSNLVITFKRALRKADKLRLKDPNRGTENSLEFKVYVGEIAKNLGMKPDWNHTYSIKELSEFEFMPVRHHRSIVKLIRDRKLKAKVIGSGSNTRYLVRVRDIIAYLDRTLLAAGTRDTIE